MSCNPEVDLPFELDEACFPWLVLPSLQLEVTTESGPILPASGGSQDLDDLLSIAIDGGAYEGDWAGLVLLRECLLKWADRAQSALQEVAKKGPAKLVVLGEEAPV